MMGLSPTQILILLLIVVVLFGAKRLPDVGRGLGRSMREFRSGLGDGDFADEAVAVDGDGLVPEPLGPDAAAPAVGSATRRSIDSTCATSGIDSKPARPTTSTGTPRAPSASAIGRVTKALVAVRTHSPAVSKVTLDKEKLRFIDEGPR